MRNSAVSIVQAACIAAEVGAALVLLGNITVDRAYVVSPSMTTRGLKFDASFKEIELSLLFRAYKIHKLHDQLFLFTAPFFREGP